MIQGSINQLLGIAATGARLSPDFETKAELQQTKKAMKGYKAQAHQWDTEVGPETEAITEAKNELAGKITETSKRQFELAPSAESFAKYKSNVLAEERFVKEGERLQKERSAAKTAAEQAKAKLNEEQERIKATRKALNANAPKSFGVREKIEWK